MDRENVVGLSMKGGRKDQFYFCLIEYFPDKDRWFLSSLLQLKDAEEDSGDDAIRSWIKNYSVKKMVVDFPLGPTACQSCLLECPGANVCPEPSVVEVRGRIEAILKRDQELQRDNPKRYEQDRNLDDEVDFGRDILDRPADSYIISRSFKRRLKKGYLPYWNRSIDFWIWCVYYNQLLDLFNVSFDSFGNTSLMIQSRFNYLRRHFPNNLSLYEGNIPITLIELLRSKVILKRDIANLNDIDQGIEARLDIIKKIEKKLNLFIYDHDLELICKNPRAFDSFLLAVSGQREVLKKSESLPDWTKTHETRFIIPHF